MSQPYILAAISREQLNGACRIVGEKQLVVFGTMDGFKLKQIYEGSKPVYFYEPG